MFKKVGFVFNADDCIGCKACAIACKNENQTPSTINWRNVQMLESGTYLSMSCNHCDSPECFRVCPERAFTKRQDGVVQIDSSLCTGCQLCVNVCPYHAPKFDPESGKVSKCQMCHTRLDVGMPPACVESCATGALQLADFSTFQDSQIVRSIPGFPDNQLTSPSIVFYPVKPRKRYFLNI